MSRWPEGLRASLPLALPTAAVGVSFGLLAEPVVGALAAVAMSALVWSGTAQFAALGVLTAGGGTLLAVNTAMLANARFVPMGFAIAPAVRGGPLRRVLTGGLLTDASFVIGHRPGGRFDVTALAWAAPVQYAAWLGGTAAGVAGASAVGDPARWGLDVLFPAFYLSLLLPELFPRRFTAPDPSGPSGPAVGRRDPRPLLVAALAAAVTLALTPVAPAGVPILAAASVALLGLWPRRRAGEPPMRDGEDVADGGNGGSGEHRRDNRSDGDRDGGTRP